MFYTYQQNNSGGWFDTTDALDVIVVIEADTYRQANARAMRLGIYFDGHGDCRCCGNRWSAQWSEDDADIDAHVWPNRFYPGQTVIHYADGTVTRL